MGCGSYSSSSFESYSTSVGKSYDKTTKRVSNQVYKASSLKATLNPKNKIRECCNNEEHPNTIPVILALDVTGSMGSACQETAEALSQIMDTLYNKFQDIEVCVMGIGDFECDEAPLQVSQFESDVRVAQQLDDIYMEHGGGGNRYESYTAAWMFGLYRTKLDAYDKQGRKGIIITMGDEPLNPDLPLNQVKDCIGTVDGEQLDGKSLITPTLYKNAVNKFDIFHIAVNDKETCFNRYEKAIDKTFGQLLGDRLKVSTIDSLADTICKCIEESVNQITTTPEPVQTKDETGAIVW